MLLSIPFQYPASYVERGRRAPRSCWLAGEAQVSVREAAPGDAPLAFVLVDASGLEPGLSSIDGRPRRILLHGGRFWRELMDQASFRDLVERRHEDYDAWAERQHDNPFARSGGDLLCWLPGCDGADRAAIERESAVGVREWNDDGGRARMEAARLRANDLLAVGGRVFERCGEPCWRVWPDRDEVVVHLTTACPEGDAGASAPGADAARPGFAPTMIQLFNIERRDDAIRCAREIGAAMEPRAGRVRLAAGARVIMPGAAAFPDDCHAIARAAEDALGALRDRLRPASREAAMSWYALRDIVEASGGHPSASLAPALAGLVRAWSREAVRKRDIAENWILYGEHGYAFRSGLHDDYGVNPVRTTLAACAVALRRWKRRPADGREWVGLAPPAARTGHGGLVVREILTLDAARRAGRELGADLDAEAAAAADGRLRLLAVVDGQRVVAAATLDRSGAVERTFGPWGRGAPRDAIDAICRHAARLDRPGTAGDIAAASPGKD